MQLRQVNWPGLMCSSALVTLLLFSFAYKMPWWTIKIGEDLGEIRISPFDTDIQLLGTTLELPVLYYLNLGAKITILLTAATLLLSSTNTFSKHSARLLDMSYRKPLYMTAFIVIFGVVSKLVLRSTSDFDLPIVGTSVLQLTSQGVKMSVPIVSSYTATFWLAVMSSILGISAKAYFNRQIRL